jgi:hypothetical protein
VSAATEQSVLGALLIDASQFRAVAEIINSEHFSRPDHRLIFKAIAALDAAGKPCDPIIVAEQLTGEHTLDAAGGLAYISQLARETPTAANVVTWAAMMRDANGAGEVDPWPEPVNLFAELGAVPFTAEDVPGALSAYPRSYAAQTGLDLNIMLVAAIVAAAACIPDQIQLCASSTTRWFAQPRLWALVIAEPGAGKTPGEREMLAPLWDLHSTLDKQWREEVAALPEDDPKPPRPRVIVGDATLEALSDVLVDNMRGVLVFTDEFSAWLGTLDQYKTGGTGGRDRGEWLRLFDGGPHSIERVKRGTVFVPNWGASILTATTPTVMNKLTRHLPEDGLLQRFLVVFARRQRILADPPPRDEIEAERDAYAETMRRLWRLTPRAHKGVVPLSGEAAQRFTAWRGENQQLQIALGSIEPALESHIAKYPTLALRLALVFHCVRIVNLNDERSRDPAAWPLPVATLELALRFLDRASQHALVFYLGRKGGSECYELARHVARFLVARTLAENDDGLQRRDLIQRVSAFRAADEGAQAAALRLLLDLGWLREAEGGYLKAVPTRYTVNPGLQARFATTAAQERERRAVARNRLKEAGERHRSEES